jgi:hypothetical protein
MTGRILGHGETGAGFGLAGEVAGRQKRYATIWLRIIFMPL